MHKEWVFSWYAVIPAVVSLEIGGITLIAQPHASNFIGGGLMISGVIILILAIIAHRTKPQTRVSQDTQQNILRIEVQNCNVLDFYPEPDNWLSRVSGRMSIVEVEAKFYPEGEIRLHSLELHMGIHTFGANRLPVIILDCEDTYPVQFQVPSRLITSFLRKSAKTYLRAIYDDRDCRSNEFGISLAYEDG